MKQTHPRHGKPSQFDLDEVNRVLFYDPETGKFFWKDHPNKPHWNGQEAGRTRPNGYVEITFNYAIWAAHTLAWAIVHGELCIGTIDHINRNKADNSIANLRKATKSQNEINKVYKNSTGYRGVRFEPRTGKYWSAIGFNKKKIYLGTFNTAEEASAAYNAKAKELYGDFAITEAANG
jgi:hypothetical protein